jgi:diguanylate cyclase (GGDEF)-like protein/PAS domain S-box-containing protein
MSPRTPLILLADDDPGARLLQTIALEGGGFKVEAVADGAQALAVYDQLKPDCLVLDVVMPKLSGFDVCREVRSRADSKHIPILILTSLDDLDSISTAYIAGATDFSQKGISPLLLVERVRFMLRAKQLQDGLIESESRLAEAQSVARIGYWEFDSDGRTVAVSPVALDILGIHESGLRSIKAFRHFVHPDDFLRVEEARAYSRANHTRISIDYRIVTPEGTERVVHMEAEPSQPATRYTRRHRVATIQDITQLRRAEDHVRLLAHFDPLTGLPNRAFLQEQLAHKLKNADRNGGQVMLATMDIEQFNRINHSLGTQAGDYLLKLIGQRLLEGVAPGNVGAEWISRQSPVIVARTSSDEFGIAVTVRPEAGHIGNALQFLADLVRAPFTVAGEEIIVGATFGAAVYPDDAADAESLLGLADAALHQAKQSARGSRQFYSAKMQDNATRRLSLESDLRRAIERDQLELHFQPRLHAQSREPVGVEALLRWRHPERGMVSPVEFIPIAESLGTIIELGEWALFKACEYAALLAHRGSPLRVAVNVSAVQLQRTAIAEQVGNALRRYNLDPSLLEIEITEGILIDRPELVRRALETLKQQNIRIALDDFGTGYSSLSYLRALPIDYLKIDRSFVADLERQDSSAIVSTILALAKGFGLRTIAEGIETERQARLLSEAGCDELQGFLFARAMSSADLDVWLSERAQRSAKLTEQRTG